MNTCAREDCDNPVSGRRKWCSEPCRKSQYASVCVDCGAPTSGSDGRRAEPRCRSCTRKSSVARGDRADMVRAMAKRQMIVRMVGEGRSNREIATELGTTVKTISWGNGAHAEIRLGSTVPLRLPADSHRAICDASVMDPVVRQVPDKIGCKT